jgi:hypothetical protein
MILEVCLNLVGSRDAASMCNQRNEIVGNHWSYVECRSYKKKKTKAVGGSWSPTSVHPGVVSFVPALESDSIGPTH